MPLTTPLYSAHIALGARMVEFAGFEMPLWYKSIAEEHQSVRRAAGLFDLGHMGILKIYGEGSLPLIQKLTTNDAERLKVGQAQYSILCNERGGVIDDVLVYRLLDYYLLVTNAVNYDKVGNWFLTHKTKECTIDRLRLPAGQAGGKWTMLSLQGPKSELILSRLCDISLSALGRHRIKEGTVQKIPCLISRSGYTGEDGFELFLENPLASKLWGALLQAGQGEGLLPCGLGARDSLRLEAALPLYGHEYSLETTPLEAGFSWAVKFEKGDFMGRSALLKQQEEGVPRKLVGFELAERAIPRQGYWMLDPQRSKIGAVTSGTLSPSLNKAVGMGYVKKECAEVGTPLFIKIREREFPAKIVPRPFYKPGR